MEQAVLGAVLVNNETYLRIADILDPEHFGEEVHQIIYRAMKSLLDKGEPATFSTVKAFIPAETTIGGGVTIGQYLAHVAAEAPVAMVSVPGQARLILEFAARRRILAEVDTLAGEVEAMEAGQDLDALISDSVGKLLQIDTGSKRDPRSIGEQVMDHAQAAFQRGEVEGIDFPLPELSRLNMGPMEAGGLYGLLGATKEGKSSLTAQIMRYAAENGHPVLCLSYDQTGEQWFRQFVSQEIGIDSNRIRRGQLTQDDYERVAKTVQRYDQMPLEIIKCSREGSDRLCAYAKKFVQTHRRQGGVPLIVADHVGKIAPFDRRASPDRIAGENNQRFKAFAGDTGAIWFNIIQRNTEGAKRQNPRPTKRDVYGGEGATADYDAIFYVYREEKWLQDQLRIIDRNRAKERDAIALRMDQVRGKAELGVIAHRFAPEYMEQPPLVKFEAQFTRYESMPNDQPEFGGL